MEFKDRKQELNDLKDIKLIEKAQHVRWHQEERENEDLIFAKSFYKRVNSYKGLSVNCYDLKDMEELMVKTDDWNNSSKNKKNLRQGVFKLVLFWNAIDLRENLDGLLYDFFKILIGNIRDILEKIAFP